MIIVIQADTLSVSGIILKRAPAVLMNSCASLDEFYVFLTRWECCLVDVADAITATISCTNTSAT